MTHIEKVLRTEIKFSVRIVVDGGDMQIVKRNKNNKMEINLLGMLQLLWKNKMKLIFASVLSGVLFLGVAVWGIQPKYTASITLYANNSNSMDKATSITSSDITASVQLVDTYAAIILTDSVLDQVIEELKLSLSCDELIKNISIEAVNDTEVFKVSVKNSSAQRATEIANKISDVAPKQIEQIVDGCSVKLVNSAKVPVKKSFPNDKKFLFGGMILGFLGYTFWMILKVVLDSRIKTEEDLAIFNLPVLARVPDFSESLKSKQGYEYSKGAKR